MDKAYLHARALLIRPPPEKSASKKTDNSFIISIKYNSVIAVKFVTERKEIPINVDKTPPLV